MRSRSKIQDRALLMETIKDQEMVFLLKDHIQDQKEMVISDNRTSTDLIDLDTLLAIDISKLINSEISLSKSLFMVSKTMNSSKNGRSTWKRGRKSKLELEIVTIEKSVTTETGLKLTSEQSRLFEFKAQKIKYEKSLCLVQLIQKV